MKKRLVSIISLIISVFITATTLSGCNLITVDNEKNMNQVIATVKISESAPTYEVKKREAVMAYLNYGYHYVNNGYSSAEVYEMIIDSLIKNKVMIQVALDEFGAGTSGNWTASEYLNEEEKTEATYNTIKSMNSLIDSYEKTDDKKSETYGAEVRTVPTNAANKEKTNEEMKAYNEKYAEKGADIGTVGSERYKAYNKTLKLLQDNALLGDDVNSIKDSDYYKQTLTANEEAMLVERYENKIKQEAIDGVSLDTLKAEYEKMYNSQKAKFDASVADFESALENESVASPVVYTPYTGYVRVYNLLLGASDEQKAKIAKLDKDKLGEVEYNSQRSVVLKGTVVKDQRASWILSGYDFDFDSMKFTGDYAFLENSLAFQGDVRRYSEKTETKDAEYAVNSVNEFGIDEFLSFMDNYVYGADKTGTRDGVNYKIVDEATKPENYVEKINELLFAFSTDPGSLNTYKGYLVKPTPDVGGNETYVKEFAEAGRKLATMGAGSYIVVETDYGYHVMFLSEVIGANAGYPTLEEYLTANGENIGDFDNIKANFEDYENSNSYLYALLSSYANADKALTDKQEEIFNEYMYNETKVVKYEKRYKDLMGE